MADKPLKLKHVIDIDAARAEGLKAAGDFLLKHARRTCPKRSGALRDSGKVEQNPETGEVAVGYTAFYASWVHENPDIKLRPPGRHKWLQLAAEEEADTMLEIVADAVREALQED